MAKADISSLVRPLHNSPNPIAIPLRELPRKWPSDFGRISDILMATALHWAGIRKRNGKRMSPRVRRRPRRKADRLQAREDASVHSITSSSWCGWTDVLDRQIHLILATIMGTAIFSAAIGENPVDAKLALIEKWDHPIVKDICRRQRRFRGCVGAGQSLSVIAVSLQA
jgi:hypothetical protein